MTKKHGISGIYGILPADISTAELLEKAEAALIGGVRTLQLRDKKEGYKKTLKRALSLRDVCSRYDARLLLNDSVQLAVEAGADGVHLGREDMPNLTHLRAELETTAAASFIVGISCKGDAAFAEHVLREGADYISCGAIFPTTSKKNATPIGLPRLAKARQIFPDANICAIGGITLESLPVLKKAGADCVAVISALFSTHDIAAQARRMVNVWDAAVGRSNDP
ncbi:MAG: thiamine phosphate synthase [Mariprofundaceae bacterium]